MTALWAKLLGVAMQSKGIKIGSILGTSGGAIALVFGLHSDVKDKIEVATCQAKMSTDLKLEAVKTELKYLKEGQQEIKALILKTNK